ncbi:type IV pili methyl-accepting chemotaxis transducer N-terminal domain-containing protein, partial [Candidatus Marithioploca araucensis]|nr:type IV pili methyl-accepting chemotaxis transducer N-terminal domain-containing protein [Candidatus Marithioploca araucensis]
FTAYAASHQNMATQINLAGKQRMLTQKMSKEILLITKSIDADANKQNLKKTAELFDKTLTGLFNGDAKLGLVKTENAIILEKLEVVKALWKSFQKNVNAVLGGDTSSAILEKIVQQNVPLLEKMNEAVQAYENASGSKITPELAKTINKAGKQRMLTQKMTKELLLVANGIAVEDNKANLAKTVSAFEKALNELIASTKDKAILAQLAKVKNLWAEYKPILDKVDTSTEALNKATKLNLPLLKEE